MTVNTGAQYLASLRDDREIWLHGQRIEDVTAAPGLARGRGHHGRLHRPAA